MEKPKEVSEKKSGVAGNPPDKTPPATAGKLPPFFRKIDWMTLVVTFLIVFIGYWITLAPEMTLEDSGELAVGSFYAGIPHPPGYPVWTVFTWLWTHLPFGNVAWRVGVSCAFAGALASGLLGMVVSRGSSMIIESIDDLKNLPRGWENAICIVSGFVAGALIGFNGYLWSQSVIVEVYPLSVVSLMGVVVCLMRWTYAPTQNRYLYWAFFLFGICVNNHQSLLVMAMGMEVLVWLANPKIGRELFFWNMLVYFSGLLIGPTILTGNTSVFVIFNVIGIGSVLMWLWMLIVTKKSAMDFARDGLILLTLGCAALFFLGGTNYIPFASGKMALVLTSLGAVVSLIFLVRFSRRHKELPNASFVVLGCGLSWIIGAAFYLYMPLAGMSNPPMEWGYPRTLEGFIHAITRGQYDKIHPTTGTGTNAIQIVGSFFQTYGMQLWRFLEGLISEFNILCLLIALVVFLFYRKMKKRERSWIMGMVAIFICLGPFLVLLLNFSSDRQSLELNRVFLTSSHVFIAMSVGYGLTLLAASMASHFNSLRKVSILGGLCALDFAVFMLSVNSQIEFDPDLASLYGYGKILCWLLAIVCIAILWRKGMERDRILSVGLPGLFVFVSLVFTLLTVLGDPARISGFGHVIQSIHEALKPNHYGLPVYAAMVLIGASVVFLFCAWKYRSKAPLAITLFLFAIMPTYSVMTHWFDNEQRQHWFGYWFGHDMFTPPFVGPDGKLSYDKHLREQALKGPNAKLVYPEMARDTILFGGTDPGRFAPTYMIFCDSFIPDKCKPIFDQKFDRRDVYIITQNALADGTYLDYLRAQYQRSAQKARRLDTPFFQQLFRSPAEQKENWETNFLAKAVTPLDTAFTALGEKIEKERRAGSSYFKPDDFLNLNDLTTQIASQKNAFLRELYNALSPKTKKLITDHDDAKLRQSLADDLNRVIEKGLYDDKPLADEIARRWDATFNLEATENDMQRAAQAQMVSQAVRLQTQARQIQQVISECDSNLVTKTDHVVEYFKTNDVPISAHLREFIQQAPQYATRIRLNRELLEAAFPKDIAVSLGGVYPDLEIYIPSPADSSDCFSEYIEDASRRLSRNELRPGEDVFYVTNSLGQVSVQVSGQVAVMAINGLLSKVIFDHNPSNEFYVEESFPLDWMYPHLTPYGIIMKVNRQNIPEITEDMVRRDHEFWSKYSERLIGNWITYDTTVKEIADFAEKVYLKRDFTGFKGDRRFLRDDQAQKAFSKLRSSIGGIYAWRLGFSSSTPTPTQYLPKNEAERQRMIKEADFAFKQSFAFCPYSPEAVFRYVQLLANIGRLDDAILVAETCHKLDPYNGQIKNLVDNLKGSKNRPAAAAQVQSQIAELQNEIRANPTNFQKLLDLAGLYFRIQQSGAAMQILDGIVANPNASASAVFAVAQAYAQLNDVPKVEAALQRMVQLAPDEPEAWYNLAATKATLGKNSDAIQDLKRSLDLNAKRMAQNPSAHNLKAEAEKDPRFNNLHSMQEYKTLMSQ
ncbi:MAG TPA: DUF2723 domain-containing protein [Verrucomicrobiae bacterium]|nr:DUF2723 domain-containing protein [Verrucomicrobiae bacterium]